MLKHPFATPSNHATPVKALYHIGASTHPGRGSGWAGMSGDLAAKAIPRLAQFFALSLN
jgi:phytoene dehydrogenase-like protein